MATTESIDTTVETNSIDITNIGPIRNLSIPIAPGVTVLRGRNECGKSTAIDAVEALTGQKRDLQATDGEAVGSVQGAGVSLVIARQARNSRAGELEVSAVEDRIDLSVLVDPPLKDKQARGRARVKALLSLTGAMVSIDDFRQLLPEDERDIIHVDDISDDPIDSAGRVKRSLDSAARDESRKADGFKEQVQKLTGALETLGEVDDEERTVEEIEAYRQEAMAEKIAMETQRRGMLEARAKRAKAQEEFEAMAESIQATRDRRDEVLGESAVLETNVSNCDSLIERLEAELKNARETRAKNQRDQQEKTAILDVLDKQLDQFNILEKLAGVTELEEPPSEEAIEEQAQSIRYFDKQLQTARDRQEANRLQLAREQTLKEQGIHLAKAERLRTAAKAIDAVLAAAIDSPFFCIVDGELCYSGFGEEARDPEPFDRLSDGKRWTVAIQAVSHGLNATERLNLVGVAQTAWESLDRANRRRVIDAAIASNLAIVTAAHDDSDTLRAEVAE